MASVTEKPQPDSPPQRAQRADEQLVDRQINRTRRALKLVDFTAGLITLAVGLLAFLLTTSVLEHWVIPGGWSETARTCLLGLLLLGMGWYSWRRFWPLLGQSINPAYAALAIEHSSPSLKNSLLNLLLLRNRRRQMSRQVYQAIEQQAAQRLSQVSLESVVDRSAILRWGYLLLALVALGALYRFLSPKDLIASSARVLLPWSSIATPSRVQILGVSPGDAKAARGTQLSVTAEVLGLAEDEPVRLYYSTADEQIVGREVAMFASAGGSEFKCQVPSRIGGGIGTGSGASSGGGIQQDFSYWIEAGDARTPRYQVSVFARPTLVVNRVRYEYPAYTGYPSRDVEHTGDLRAVEGTKVTLFAQANKPIKTAHVDFEADGRRDLLMQTNDQQATVTFPLSLRDDRRTPRYQSYALRYLTTSGNQNSQPPKYQIDVQPDYAPEIQLVLPAEPLLEVALNQEVNFELEARDPDFALSQVLLIGKVGDEPRLKEELLTRNHTGRFLGKLRKTPAEMGLQVGEVLEYWGAAADNRQPEASIANSAHRKLRVIGPWQGDPDGQQDQRGAGRQQPGEAGEPQEGEAGQPGQAGGGQQGGATEGEAGEDGAEGSGQAAGEPGDNQEQQPGPGGAGNSADGQPADSGGAAPADESADSDSQDQNGAPSADRADDPAGGEGGEQGKVSSAGDDDGSAFERMAKHFQELDGEQAPDSTGTGQSGQADAANQANQAKSDRDAADGSPDSDQAGDARPGESQSEQRSAAENGAAPADEQAADDEPGGKEGTAQDGEADGGGAAGQPAPGEQQQQGGGQQQQQQQEGESPDGKMSPEQGDAGGGDSSGDDQGAPNAEGANRPRDKQGDKSAAAQQQDAEAPSQGQGKTESDSDGGQGGDQSGGGQEGMGQQAEADGKGGAGEHQAADDGAGQASEPGEGETGKQPGNSQQAAGETGESSGDQPGAGSEQGKQPGEQPHGGTPGGGQDGAPGAEPAERQPAESGDGQRGDGERGDGAEASADPSAAQGLPGDPGGTGGNSGSPPPGGETEPGDEANLEYARQQTDLILDRLEDQLEQQQVDQRLLEKLGWTPEELRRFVDRWNKLKLAADDPAGAPDAKDAANNELLDALRSLGLDRSRPTGFGSKMTKDKLRDLQDSFRGRVPLEFQEQVRSYIKGTALSGTAVPGTTATEETE